MKDWPLVAFTLAIQAACGLAVSAAIFDVTGGHGGWMRPLAMAIFPIVAAGIAASVAHLGRPMAAWRALRNAPRSPLSREARSTALFALLALGYSGLGWLGRTDGRMALGIFTAAAGLKAVLDAAEVYRIRSRPVWNSGWVPMSFVATSLLLGGLLPAVLARWSGETEYLPLYLVMTLGGGLLLAVAALWMKAIILRGPAAARFWGPRESAWLAWHVLLLPPALAILLYAGAALPVALMDVLAALVLAGAALGRAMLYRIGDRCEPF